MSQALPFHRTCDRTRVGIVGIGANSCSNIRPVKRAADRDLLITTANSFPEAECLLNIVPGIADSKHTISSCVLRTWSLLLRTFLCVAGLVFQLRLFSNLLSAYAGSVCTIHNFRNRNNLDSAIHENVRSISPRQGSSLCALLSNRSPPLLSSLSAAGIRLSLL
eukprot:COSAG01_NODE_1966_length_8778_cov_41.983176_13_plen_164_part_00